MCELWQALLCSLAIYILPPVRASCPTLQEATGLWQAGILSALLFRDVSSVSHALMDAASTGHDSNLTVSDELPSSHMCQLTPKPPQMGKLVANLPYS